MINLIIIKRIIIYLCILSFTFCSKDKNFLLQDKPLWENKKEINIQELLSIGTDDLAKPNTIFGGINDIAVDKDNNIYILDFVNYKVAKFDLKGQFIRNYGLGRGQGPGEFQFPTSVCVDFSGNVYICDSTQRKISVFDPSNKLINIIRTEKFVKPLNGMAVYNNSTLYVGADVSRSDWNDGMFLIYSLPEGKYMGSIGDLDWFKKNRGVLAGANNIVIDYAKEIIIISHSNPYQIDVYSKKGKLLKCFGRKTSFFDNILYDARKNKIADGATLRTTCLPNGIIVNIIRHLVILPNDTIIIRYFDFFDTNGNYLMTVPEKEFGIEGRYNLAMTSDSLGNIWLSYQNPYPHVSKFKVEFKDKMR